MPTKILVTSDVRLGIKNALASLNMQGMVWTPTEKPAFDVFAELEPNLVICKNTSIDRATVKCLQARPNLKVIMFDGGESKIKTDYPTIPEPLGIDTLIYTQVPRDPLLKCDVSFMNNGDDDDLIAPLCFPVGKYNIKIYGKPLSLCPQWCGFLHDGKRAALFNSSRINLVTKNSDPELIYQIIGAGQIPWVQGVNFETAEDLEKLVYGILHNHGMTLQLSDVCQTAKPYIEIVQEWL